MATRTTEASNTLETFRVNFNGLVDDIGNVTVSSAGDLAKKHIKVGQRQSG